MTDDNTSDADPALDPDLAELRAGAGYLADSFANRFAETRPPCSTHSPRPGSPSSS